MDPEILLLLSKIEARNRRYRSLWAGALIIAGLAMIFSPVFTEGAAPLFWFWSGLILMLLGVFLFLYAFYLYPFHKEKVSFFLQKYPNRIVWVHPYIMEMMPFGITLFDRTRLYFHLFDGKNLQLYCRYREAMHLMNHLPGYLKWATFGYSQEKEFLYENDPASLLRETGRKE